jgi:putative flippase GtrA
MTPRLGRFALVGAVGFAVQLATVGLLTIVWSWPAWLATAVGVEAAIVHNLLWHERWTWGDRHRRRVAAPDGTAARVGAGSLNARVGAAFTAARVSGGFTARRLLAPFTRLADPGAAGRFDRALRFHATNGATSLLANVLTTLVLARAFDGRVGATLAANALAVVAISAANYLLADRWVFASGPIVVPALCAFLIWPGQAAGAELQPETASTWNRYAASAERTFFSGPAPQAAGGAQGRDVDVPGGTIHEWRGTTVIRGITVDSLVHALTHPGTPPPQSDVLEARVLGRRGDELHVYLKLRRTALVTVTYDTEHDVAFVRHDAELTTSRSASTKIVEVGGGDRGFLWRLNSYWQYRQVPGGVRVDVLSLSLSRRVPGAAKFMVAPIVNRIGRESMARTLDAMSAFGRQLAARGPGAAGEDRSRGDGRSERVGTAAAVVQ